MIRTIDAIKAAAACIGGETPRLDAEVLLAHHLGCSRGDVLLNPARSFDPQEYDKLVERRASGEPLAHITGTRDFWTLTLKVGPDVLIPRPDTETLVEVALKLCSHPPVRILDLGTGSGALLLACLSEWPQATGLGVDASQAALSVAQENAQTNGFADRATFSLGNWGEGLCERFDLILSNPPYIAETEDISYEVRTHEPANALFAGADGLEDYRRILPQLPGLLAPGGLALLEIGHKQGPVLLEMAVQHGFSASLHPDLAGRDRCVALHVPAFKPAA